MFLISRLLTSPGKQKRYQHLIRDTSRRSLALARSNRNTILAKKKFRCSQIEEAEEYLGLLRQECALLDMEIMDADDEVNGVKCALNTKRIAESSLSDDEDDGHNRLWCLPPSSNPSSHPIRGCSGSSSATSDSYLFHYGSDDVLPPDNEIEVAGERVSEKDTMKAELSGRKGISQ